jgi:hypothetical protein
VQKTAKWSKQGVVTLIAFWPEVPRQPNQLRKLQILTCTELAAISTFAAAYVLQVWHHNREMLPDAQVYLQLCSSPPNNALWC